MRKTKITCTLGPAVDTEEKLRELMLTGMNCARFNFSHGTHESQLATLTKLKKVREELGLAVATMLDTKGPEIRVKSIENGPITLVKGETLTLTTEDVVGNSQRVAVTYANLHKELTVGNRVLIDDGLVELKVQKIEGAEITCQIENGGNISSNKSINIPDVHIQLPSLTEKDKGDLKFGVENDYDFVAASFVRSASDVADVRNCLDSFGGQGVRIIAKIENREGVDNLEEIIAAADGIMVARGDLGVEIPAYEVPVLQKKMIKSTIAQGKPVITATQMLDSMMRNPRPTRAEVSDVANAVFDGTSCVMLSGESANGSYPIEALSTMIDVVTAAENAIDYWSRFREKAMAPNIGAINDAITHSCCHTAMDLDASAIVAATLTGHSARAISRFRPPCPIVAMCETEKVRRQLGISWGVYPQVGNLAKSTDELFDQALQMALVDDVAKKGDTVVLTAGVPIGKSGSTNLIKADVI